MAIGKSLRFDIFADDNFGLLVTSRQLPKSPGIYAIFHGPNLLYIGESQNLRARASAHLCVRRTQGKINYLPAEHIPLNEILFRFILFENQELRKEKEFELIARFKPPFNNSIAHRYLKHRGAK